jgi:2-C-methyl-D-erythritol 4-phosphate cytidylyltransferase
MFKEKRIGGILLMAGEGRRFGRDLPKQFQLLGGKKVFLHSLETFLETGWLDEMILVCPSDWVEIVREEIGMRVVAGGRSRQESSYLGLLAFSTPPDVVVIHDGVRPFLTKRILKENIETALAYGAADTCIPSADTLVHVPDGQKIATIPNRREYLRGQTPQSFRFDLILEAHQKTTTQESTDDCRLVLDLGHPVHIVLGDERNLKITSPLDLLLAEQLLTRDRNLADE